VWAPPPPPPQRGPPPPPPLAGKLDAGVGMGRMRMVAWMVVLHGSPASW
jgi:hypothetical protein